MHLHAGNIPIFSKQYDLVSIPRLILIDKEGNFVDSKMPYPYDKGFEKLLRETLGLPEKK
ncbi:hypothetical protein HYN59_09975 [Flavobacterium album]|uniref:Thioredoxin-like fold domain-containing protein n=1 Tax=Flavobacterium album TaxID=2175091 RepID=A0A2S1QYE0_9FLAO|nr:hypothetical protein [Flavobacterium album]AWH85423.1 hypothetical protein HYN59_09975 [Flavobacterium album]